MKGNIELNPFVKQVKKELIAAQEKDSESSFALEEVELEVAFVVDVSAKAKTKLFVVDSEAQAGDLQIHRVRLRFTPPTSGKKKKEKRKNSLATSTASDSVEEAGSEPRCMTVTVDRTRPSRSGSSPLSTWTTEASKTTSPVMRNSTADIGPYTRTACSDTCPLLHPHRNAHGTAPPEQVRRQRALQATSTE